MSRRYSLTAAERETVIRWDDVDNVVSIYTTDSKTMTKLNKLVESCPELYSIKKQDDYSKTYILKDSRFISYRKPVKMSEELLERKRAHFAGIRQGAEASFDGEN